MECFQTETFYSLVTLGMSWFGKIFMECFQTEMFYSLVTLEKG